jgi:hypothetical protein
VQRGRHHSNRVKGWTALARLAVQADEVAGMGWVDSADESLQRNPPTVCPPLQHSLTRKRTVARPKARSRKKPVGERRGGDRRPVRMPFVS